MSDRDNVEVQARPQTSWIYKLSKRELIKVLRTYQKSVDADLPIDTLRKQLATIWKQISNQASSDSGLTEDNVSAKRTQHEVDPGASEVTETSTQESIRNIEGTVTVKSREDDITMSASKLEFQLGEDDWDTYVERMELYFVASDVPDEKKTAVLLTKVSADTYALIRDLCSPVKPIHKTFVDLVTIVKNHLCPKPSITMERCRFHQANQSATETIAEFSARLKKLALNCSFPDLDVALRDQLVCGLYHQAIKTALFKEENLTFEKAYKMATSQEEAEKNASRTSRMAVGTSGQENVHALFARSPHSGPRGKPQGSKPSGRGGSAAGSNAKKPWHPAAHKQKAPGVRCYCCNQSNHLARNCSLRFKTCEFCHRRGHVEAACRKKQQLQFLSTEPTEESSCYAPGEEDDIAPSDGEDCLMLDVISRNTRGEPTPLNYVAGNGLKAAPLFVNVLVDKKVNLSMEVDTGTYVSVISEVTKNACFSDLNLSPHDIVLKSYGSVKLAPLGQLKGLRIEFLGKQRVLNCYVMPGEGPSLIGREWLEAFQAWPVKIEVRQNNNIHEIHKLVPEVALEQFAAEYKTLFGPGPGLYNKGSIKLTLKDGAKPVAFKARHVPFALQDKIEEELNRLLEAGHIEKVDVSEWLTPIVPIVKSTGKVRLCGNFKLTVNPNIIIDKHPLPLIDEIFAKLQGGELFSQIDLTHSYMQILVDEESRDCLTIVTHKGLFRYKKMPEGVASGPGCFQRIMESCLAGIPNTAIYLDNIYCTGKTEKEHSDTLHQVCKRLEECGLRVNKKKCEFFKPRIEILGFLIDKSGLHKDPAKVAAILAAPRPEDVKQLLSFLGMVTYYGRFLPNRADKLQSLYTASTSEGPFEWNEQCESAYQWVKTELTSPRVLAHYDPKQKLLLACDASAYGLGAVLSHIYADGTERPIAFASKVIPLSERNRATIDKEASAIVFGFKKFYNFVYGRQITLRTDHKPLTYIFGPKTEIPAIAAGRLQRWAWFLSGFTYDIQYTRSSENSNCDALSRLPIDDKTPVFDKEYSLIHYIEETNYELLNFETLATESQKDVTLKRVIRYVKEGWPNPTGLTDVEKKYKSKDLELVVEQNCLLWGIRVIIPESMRPQVLRDLHASHLGIVKMKMLARSYFWWPGLDQEIENLANVCKICLEERKRPAKAPLNPWPWPDRAWSRIHTDFLGRFHGHMFMVVVDAHSKWPEAIDMGTNTQTDKVIVEFRKLFARFGLPRHVVSDCGRQYTSDEFKTFLARLGVKQSFSAPYHPATNGAAENFVGTFKDKVNKIMKDGKSLEHAVSMFLFDYRCTEHCTTGRSPAYLMYKRDLRTRFDLLKPSNHVVETVEKKQQAQIKAVNGRRQVSVNVGDSVMVDDHRVDNNKRVEAVVTRKISPVNVEVQVNPSLSWKRHIDQVLQVPNEPRRSARLQAMANRE